MQAVNEIPPLAAWAPLDDRHVLEFKRGHGKTSFKGPADLVRFRPWVRYYPDAQKARLILDKLNVSNLIIKCVVV
jgi:hypothetical protein